MDATKKSGVTHGLDAEFLQRITKKGGKVVALIGEPSRIDLLLNLEEVFQAYLDGVPFGAPVLKPRTLAELLGLSSPTQSLFNQLVSEVPFWELLDQIESASFGKPEMVAKIRPFIADLWKDEVATDPFKPPKGFAYSPAEEAVAAYRRIFGSSLKADTILTLAKQAKDGKDAEGIPIGLKLSTLAKLFGVSGNPLEITDEGRTAYARVVELFVPEVGETFVASGLGGFKNWCEGRLTANHVILTPAGIATWQWLEQITDDDFCYSPAGAVSGAGYAGHSVRLARIRIVLAGKQMPQDCVMTGETLATQPERMSKHEHLGMDCLGMDCPGNAYSPVAGGRFHGCLYWNFDGNRLRFGNWGADRASRRYGSAVLLRS